MIGQNIAFSREVEAQENPFPGLRPFEFGESHLYFGRDGQSEQLLKKLSATRLLAVVGTSGSGKSSLVRAGLLPTLFGGFMASAGSNWKVAIMRPGNNPLGNLAHSLNTPDVFGSEIEENAQLQTAITEATLRRGSLGLIEVVRQNRMPASENLLVVVDQFEEIFRFAEVSGSQQYQNEAHSFVKLLLEASRQREQAIYVVLTLRSDYLGDCALFWDLPEAINEGQYLIPRLTREQRREAITGPVAVGGAEITPRLVTQLLNEMGDNPDQLPILQHALMRTWECWRQEGAFDEPIDIQHYEAIGGMALALSRHADEAYNELPDERSRLIAEKMFKGLTEKGADNRETRRPIELHEICSLTEASEDEVKAVIEPFRREGRSFLMPPASVPLQSSSLIDISHESLIRNWDRLKQWVEDEGRSARIYLRLSETALLHEKGEAGLWRDPDLQLALLWREQSQPNRVWAERYNPNFEVAMRFLDASVAARDAEVLERERQRKRRLRWLTFVVAVLSLLLLLSLGALVFANQQRVRTVAALAEVQRERNESDRLKQLAELQRAAAEESALRAEEQSRIAVAQKSLADEQTLLAVRKVEEAKESARIAAEQAAIARRNEQQARAARSEALRSGAVAVEMRGKAEAEVKKNYDLSYVTAINFAQREFELGNNSRVQELLDQIYNFDPNKSPGYEWYYLWGLNHLDQATIGRHDNTVRSVAISSNGVLASGSYDGTLSLWSIYQNRMSDFDNLGLSTRKSIEYYYPGHLTTLSFSHDGNVIAIGTKEGTVEIGQVVKFKADWNPDKQWDFKKLESFKLQKGQSETASGVLSLSFSPDDKYLAVSSSDKTIRLFDLTEHREKGTLYGHGAPVLSIAFSPQGLLASSSSDKTVRLWDTNAMKEMPAPLFDTSAIKTTVLALAFSPDGKALAAGCEDGNLYLWSINSNARAELQKFTGKHADAISSVAFSPDGKTLATGSGDKTLNIWDIKSKKIIKVLRGYDDGVTSVSFSPDGRFVASGSFDKQVRLGYVPAKEPVKLDEQTDSVLSLAFSNDGKLLAMANYHEKVTLWDINEQEKLRAFEHGGKYVALSPDGKLLAMTGTDGIVKLWDVEHQTELKPLVGHTKEVFALTFSRDGMLATGSVDETIRLWDVKAGKELAKHAGYKVTAIAFSPDGGRLFAGSNDGSLGIWTINDTARKFETRKLINNGSTLPMTLAVSPDGKTLAVGYSDGEVTLSPADQPENWKLLAGHDKAHQIYTVAFSSDSRTLASGGFDMTLKLWSVPTAQELLTLKDFKGAISALAFSPAAQERDLLVVGSALSPVRLYYAASKSAVASEEQASIKR
ncbi:MAG TPA: hypothetical protein VGB17_01765 [Pyrinomonadaceae bacterium]|jgi:WD40 repeat protein